MVLIIKTAGKSKLLPSAGNIESGIRPTSYVLPFKPFDSKYGLNTHTLQVSSSTLQNELYVDEDASVPTNAITQSPCFGLVSCGQLLNKYPFGNTPVVAYDAVSVILSPQTINVGSEPLEAKKLYRSNYELKSNFVIAFGTGGMNTSFDAQIISSLFSLAIAEFGPQLEQVAVIHQQVQDNVL
ncbi:MAG: hypothetical protein EZS28_030763 [Streblomastix strix]|uniref:Uncharacterized protein n=1 Tax=Streblomastix strix TaxID=222440 RepID=A0A5J4UU79_9EUKA|nr:MAG: hypothetical protein EZS28_030763 [Streblomastix strix]